MAILLSALAIVRADVTLEQKITASNLTATATLKVHGDQMRFDQSNTGLSVIINMKTRDSYTLLTNKTYLFKFGSEVLWEMKKEKEYTHGTNEMDAPSAPAIDTGKTEVINGRTTKIYEWSGAYGHKMTLWVDTNFPNWKEIRTELAKMDAFNETGPHPNAQPSLSTLPGMVIQTESRKNGHVVTFTLDSVKLEPLDPALFEIPAGYTEWKQPQSVPQKTNTTAPH